MLLKVLLAIQAISVKCLEMPFGIFCCCCLRCLLSRIWLECDCCLQYKRELICKTSGVEFVSAAKLREIYPQAAVSSTEQCSDKQQVLEAGVAWENAAVCVESAAIEYEVKDKTEFDGDRAGSGKVAEDDEKVVGLPVAVGSGKVSRKGTEVSLVGLRLRDDAATLVAVRLSLIVACVRCSNRDDVKLNAGQLYTVSCSHCHTSQLVQFHADIAHSMSTVIGFMDVDGCQPVDLALTTSQFLVGCLACNNDTAINVSLSLHCLVQIKVLLLSCSNSPHIETR